MVDNIEKFSKTEASVFVTAQWSQLADQSSNKDSLGEGQRTPDHTWRQPIIGFSLVSRATRLELFSSHHSSSIDSSHSRLIQTDEKYT